MVRFLAGTVLGLAVFAARASAADAPAGEWANVDENTRGLTRVEIIQTDQAWTIRAWGAAGGGENDLGTMPLELLGDSVGDRTMKYGYAAWDHKFADMHLTLRWNDRRLVVESFTIFKDKSRRSNYRARYEFDKVK